MGQILRGSVPSGEVTTRKICRISGNSATFAQLNAACRIWEGSDGMLNISSPHVGEACFTKALAGELWMDRFLDRFIEDCPGPHVRFARSYSQVEYVVINAIMDLFGEKGNLTNCQKQLFLAP